VDNSLGLGLSAANFHPPEVKNADQNLYEVRMDLDLPVSKALAGIWSSVAILDEEIHLEAATEEPIEAISECPKTFTTEKCID